MDNRNAISHSKCVDTTRGCFVAGTLVHTKNGLVPIQELRVGDLVLSQPEMKGPIAFKPIVKIFHHDNREILHVRFMCARDPAETSPDTIQAQRLRTGHLFVTGAHAFWSEDSGWTRASRLEYGCVFELRDGCLATVAEVNRVYSTDIADTGWSALDSDEEGIAIDFRDARIAVATDVSYNWKHIHENPDSLIRRQVFNIEVDEWETYYVGECGVWVHCQDQ